jgi:hypothetical protein
VQRVVLNALALDYHRLPEKAIHLADFPIRKIFRSVVATS